jgi:antitoxin (DNA-binding transcriptional repressor) of toxin-antitoxin stability system
MMETIKVGIREFRANLAEFIAASHPVAVTRHGQTVGIFIPTHGQVEGDIAALKKAGKALDRLMDTQKVDIEDVVTDFKVARTKASPAKKAKAKNA